MGRQEGVGSRRLHGYSHCALNEAQKQPQCTYQAKTVVGSSLTPHAALLVHPSGTVYPVLDRYEFTGSLREMLPVKADLAICSPVIVSLVCLDRARV